MIGAGSDSQREKVGEKRREHFFPEEVSGWRLVKASGVKTSIKGAGPEKVGKQRAQVLDSRKELSVQGKSFTKARQRKGEVEQPVLPIPDQERKKQPATITAKK